MNSSLVIEAADRSGRWYLLPGSPNSYELKLTNESDHGMLCKLNLDEPADAGTVNPTSVTLQAGESRIVSISFKPEWLTLRDRKAVISARDAAGTVLATFVHDLVAATTTDCSISLAWKEPIEGEGALRGFVLLCTIRSISSTPGIFEPDFTTHPSLRLPEKQRITLGPGESAAFDVPVVWNRSARDNEGWNHPRSIDVGVPVTHGRRTASAPWDLVQQHIEPYLTEADRAPMLARRAPPPQFVQPGGGPPPVSPLTASTLPEPSMGPVVTESHSARIARSELEAGVTAGGMRLPPQSGHPPVTVAADRETIAVAPGTLLLVAFALCAIAIVVFWMLRQPTNITAVSTTPVQVTSPALPNAQQNVSSKRRPRPAGTQAPATGLPLAVANPTVGQPASRTVAPTPASIQPPKARSTAPRARQAASVQRQSPIDRAALVQLENVGAEYLRGGRAVHVSWDSYAQASANIQLLNDQNTIIAQSTVGRRMGAILPLPRGYRGNVYVQVTAFGYHGERVVSTTLLGAR
jgi:hypothetical protein